jgi:uncharacterized membrane protein
VLDLMLLASAMISSDSERRRVAAATAGVAGVAVLDLAAGIRHSVRRESRREAADGGVKLTAAITVKRPVGEVYEFWRNLENLPRIMSHLESVRVMDARRSHWVAKAPAGFPVEWDAETVAETPNELIAWRSLPGSRVDNSGRVRFTPAPGGRGTEIRVEMRYQPPGGPAAARIAKLFNEIPKTQLLQDLRRFKQTLETGEVVVSDATIAARPRPAQPPPPSGDDERARRRATSATAAAPSTLS